MKAPVFQQQFQNTENHTHPHPFKQNSDQSASANKMHNIVRELQTQREWHSDSRETYPQIPGAARQQGIHQHLFTQGPQSHRCLL